MSESERVHFKIALPVDLKKRLEHDAVDNRRSLSAEIIARLEASFQSAPSGTQFFGSTIVVEDIAAKIAEHLKADPGIVKITGEDAKLTVGRKTEK